MEIDKKLFRAGPYSDFFSQGVQVGNILTLAGQLGDDAEGKVPDSIREQMENCYKNIQNVLNQFCSGLLKLDTQLSGNLPLERSVHYEEKTHV